MPQVLGQAVKFNKGKAMIVKYDKTNTNFQIAYFIAGSCYTADAAYIALLTLKNDRLQALDAAKVAELKRMAARIRAKKLGESENIADKLESQAELLEIEHSEKLTERLIKAAQEEVEFIDYCIQQVQPLRKYAHLDDHAAAEACQREEWLGELVSRAENYMMTQGTIPHDQLLTMRQHPDFASVLLPRLEQLHVALSDPISSKQILLEQEHFNLPKVLGWDQSSS